MGCRERVPEREEPSSSQLRSAVLPRETHKVQAMRSVLPSLSVVLLAVTSTGAAAQLGAAPRSRAPQSLAPEYTVEFVASPASASAMNGSGEIAGGSYLDNGCGPFCMPPHETVEWRAGERIVLPDLPGLTGSTATDINDAGWVVGYAGSYWFPRAVVWQPVGNTYQALDLGFLPGTNKSRAVGIDDQNRVVGWSTDGNAIFPVAAPFSWSVSTGMVDLSLLGYPDEEPLAMSPGGAVATATAWYRLGDASSVTPMATPPTGFGMGGEPTAINDAGDQARFLVRVGPQNLVYLFRYHHGGSWQQLSPFGTGHLSSYGVGSINDAGDLTATIGSSGVIAYGPDGTAQTLASLLSPSFQGNGITVGGPMNRNGEILTEVMLGSSSRLVRLTPALDCWNGCLRVRDLSLGAVFVPDPRDPTQDHCSPDLNAHNEALVTLTVTTAAGVPQGGARVFGRFLDNYWTNQPVSGVTDANGAVSFSYSGPCGVGTLTFLVEDARLGQASLDKTKDILSVSAIPQ